MSESDATRYSGPGLVVCDRHGRVVNTAGPVEALLGAELVVDQDIGAVLGDPALFQEILEAVRPDGCVERRVSGPAGMQVRLRCLQVAVGGEPYVLVVLDRAEEAGQPPFGYHGFFGQVVRSLPEAVVVSDGRGRIVYANPAVSSLFGYDSAELVGRRLTILVPEKFRERHEEAFRSGLAPGRSVRLGPDVAQGRRKDGTTFPLSLTMTTLELSGQVCAVAFLRDESEWERLRQARERSQEFFRALIEYLPEAVVVHREGRVVYANPAAARLLAYEDPGELVGREVLGLVHPEDREVAAGRIQALVATGSPAPPLEERLVRRDGTVVEAEVRALLVEFEGAPSVLAVVRDLTTFKQVQATMMAMDRMITMGTLAAAVGHEVNNPLTYVMGNLTLALEDLDRIRREGLDYQVLERLVQSLRDALEGTRRIRNVVSDLRRLARARDAEMGPVDLHRVVESAVNMAFNEIRHRARLVKDFRRIPKVWGDESRLGQVVLNLLLNAAQALQEGNAAEDEIRVRTWSEGDEVIVEVRDTGPGVPPENRDRIFEPFFTTKREGQGTGLGLAICHRIVQDHGGSIRVLDGPEGGAVFQVRLPAAPPDAQEGSEQAGRDTGRFAARGRVLVVDDEPSILRLVSAVLSEEHQVVPESRAERALERLRSGEEFHVILCDLLLPGMSGQAFYEAVQAEWPELAERFVFLTGGAFTPEAKQFLESVAVPCVEKPFSPTELRKLVRKRVFEARGGRRPSEVP